MDESFSASHRPVQEIVTTKLTKTSSAFQLRFEENLIRISDFYSAH